MCSIDRRDQFYYENEFPIRERDNNTIMDTTY